MEVLTVSFFSGGWVGLGVLDLNCPSEGFNSFFYLFTAGFYFISRYAGRNVTAVVGSTLNFSSTFKGDGSISPYSKSFTSS